MKLALKFSLLALALASTASAQAPSAYKQQFVAEFIPGCQADFVQSLNMSGEQARKTCKCIADELVTKHDEAWLHELASPEPMSEAMGAEVDRVTDMCMAR